MNKKAIIHISDLHISTDTSVSKLCVTSDSMIKDEVSAFERIFLQFKRTYIDYEDTFLIISGDISNSGSASEYELANSFINKLEVRKQNILIIPGNHDINWADNEVAWAKEIAEKGGKENARKPFEFQKEKFNNFSTFYDTFFEGVKTFNPEKIIVDVLDIASEQLLIVGINSCLKCNSEFDKGIGYINFDTLDLELNTLVKKFYDYSIIAVCHHNPFANYKDHPSNGFEDGNWQRVRSILIKHNIHVVLFGHEHTQDETKHNDYEYLSVGSFAKKNVDNEFELLFIEKDGNNLTLKPNHAFHKNGNNRNDYDGFWSLLTHSPYNRPIPLIQKPDTAKIIAESFLADTKTPTKDKEIENIIEKPQLQIENKFQAEIFKRIKELRIFKSGHFHWSDSSRAHNWIDTPKLLNRKEDIYLIQKSILQSIEDNNIQFDLIIGLGIEGNIIATRCAAKFNTQYTYLPYSYRYDDHSYYEKDLKLSKYDFKKILIITDVVHDGRTIKNILKDESDFFSHCQDVEEINVIALFYTGDKEKYKRELLHEGSENRFNFYYVCHIRVEECPYKSDSNWEVNCKIYCEKLDKIYEFYNKK